MIEKVKSGSVAKNKKLNEVIAAVNSLTGMTVREGSSEESPKLVFAERKSELITTGGGAGGGGGGGGLPSFPTDNGNVPDFKGILAWSVTEGEALWLQGDPNAEDSESNPLPQVMIYDPTDGFKDFSLLGMQLLDVVICKDGAPVNGKIFFKEDDI